MKTRPICFLLSLFWLLILSGQAVAAICLEHPELIPPTAAITGHDHHQMQTAKATVTDPDTAVTSRTARSAHQHDTHDCCTEDQASQSESEENCDSSGGCAAVCPTATAWFSTRDAYNKPVRTADEFIPMALTAAPVLKPAMIWRPPIHA
ncbi:MAG: hypothetical protein RQ757_01385 [Pseudomonadales bacterium]|nr:hypothetical protein [Pseudomonadales bacterium]